MNKIVKRVRVNWYKLLYSLKDEKLISYFWKYYNTHKLSKNRCARYCLINYYSTTSMPEVVKKYFTLNSDIKKMSYNFYG